MSEGDSLMGFDSNIHNDEDLYQRYPLIDLEIATSEWDTEEITVLYEVLRKDRLSDETDALISGWLRRRAVAAGYRFHPGTYKTPANIRKELTDLDRYLDNYRRRTPLKIPEPVMEFIHILETEPEKRQEILRQAEIRDLLERIECPPGREGGREEEAPETADDTGSPLTGPEMEPSEDAAEDGTALPALSRIRLLIDGAILWNIHLQTGLDFRCWQLREVVLREGVRFIDQSVFAYCVNLRSVTIPDSVRKIGIGAFAMCPSLVQIRISERAAERLFSPVRIREGTYIQIGCRCFEHFEWAGPRDGAAERPLLGHSAVTNDSDYLKSPWYVRRVKAAITYNQYVDPRYPRRPEELEQIRRGMPRPGEIVFCPSCFTPYSRELRSLLSACPHCGRLLMQRKGEADPALILRRYDPEPDQLDMSETGLQAEGEEAACWRRVLRVLTNRACDPVLLAGICREAMDKGQEQAALTLSMSRDLAGGGSLPPAFADPGISVYMAWQKERKAGKDIDLAGIERRKNHYGCTGRAFDRVLGSEIVPLLFTADRAGLRITRTDWTYTVPETGTEEADRLLDKKGALTDGEKQALLQKWELTLLLTLRWDRPDRDRRLTAADLLRLPFRRKTRK